MPAIKIKKGDTARVLSDQLFINALPLDLTGATVTFSYRKVGSSVVTSRTATIGDPVTDGKVSYQITSNDFTEPGQYQAEWRVSFGISNPTHLHFPANGHFELEIIESLS